MRNRSAIKIVVIVGAVVIFAYGGYRMSLPRGIRNNNPGNIKFSPANDWNGQVGQGDTLDDLFRTAMAIT